MTTSSSLRALGARPLHAVAVLVVTFVLGNALLAGCSSKSETSTTSSSEPAASSGATTPSASASAGAAPDGAKIYAEKCSVCHGPGGKGDGPGGAALNPKPRDHTNGAYMNSRTDDELLQVIANGKGNMPAWKSVLSEDERKAVLKHVRSLAVPPYPG